MKFHTEKLIMLTITVYNTVIILKRTDSQGRVGGGKKELPQQIWRWPSLLTCSLRDSPTAETFLSNVDGPERQSTTQQPIIKDNQ